MLSLSANSDYTRKRISVANEYYDWSNTTDTGEVWGKQALDQMIENVLMTEPFERLFNLDFGSPLYEILFENFNQIDALMPQVLATVEYWVPVKINRNSINIEKDEDNHAISFQLEYTSNNGVYKNVKFARRLTA